MHLFPAYAGVILYKFTNSIEWALYVGVHRGKINRSSYKKLDNFVSYIDSYDIVVGPIADDHMHETYTDFLDGVITDTVLVKCLSEIQLGNQYVFKNNRACKNIRIMRTETLSKDERKRLKHAWRVKIGTMDKSLGIIKSDYRRKGLFVDELLKHWG